jgi:6-pyruvoyl-tetrahydropterin synthase related domain
LLRHPIVSWLILAAVCSLAIAPFLWWGSPSGHDFEFHLYSWMDAQAQWQQGMIYPRWAAWAHWGYGEPRFLFYPPVSWMLGAALGWLLPWKVVPGVYCWLALTLAGAGMYEFAKQSLRPADALFAAVFYALNPYHLLVVYWRSAYAELLCAGLLPLLLLLAARLQEPSLRPTLWLSLILAGAWLTNAPVAVMMHYSAAGLALLAAARERSPRPVWRLAGAVLLGAGLAAIYLVPAVYEQRWVHIAEVLSSGVRPQDNFLFTRTGDADHDHFNGLVSLVALAEMVVLGAAIYFSRQERRQNAGWTPLAIWGTGTALVMFSASNAVWEYLPKFRFVQLPFRWLLCMNAAAAILLAVATSRNTIPRWIVRGAAWVALLAALLFVGGRTQMPWWDTAADIEEMRQSMDDGTGNEGVDEYVPAGADAYELKKDLPQLSDEAGRALNSAAGSTAPVPGKTGGAGKVNTPIENARVVEWSATEKRFQAVASRAANATVRLFNYPAWEVTVNGRRVATATTEVTGLMVVPLVVGKNDAEVHFARTRDRWLGDAVTLLSLAAFAAGWMGTRQRPVPGARL